MGGSTTKLFGKGAVSSWGRKSPEPRSRFLATIAVGTWRPA